MNDKLIKYLDSLSLPDVDLNYSTEQHIPDGYVRLIPSDKLVKTGKSWEVCPVVTSNGEIIQSITIDDTLSINLSGEGTLRATTYLLSELLKSAKHFDKSGRYVNHIKRQLLDVLNNA